MGLLRRVDLSFERGRRTFRASYRDGFLLDLVRLMRHPPRQEERSGVADPATDLDAVQIEGLIWNESSPAFAAMAIDARGFPLRMVTPDPRAFAVHKLWMSRRADCDPFKTARDIGRPGRSGPSRRATCPTCPYLPFRPENL